MDNKHIDFSNFIKARAQFNKKEMPFLSAHLDQVVKHRPYAGLRLYHNIPLTLSTFLKIEVLLRGGAEVIVSNVNQLQSSPLLTKQLIDAGLTVDLEKKQVDAIDVYLDCVAEMVNFPVPNLGYVELTQTGTEIYKKHQLLSPVISVDDCAIKVLETIGTGEGFVRAMKEYANFPLNSKKIILFGYGKVGRGIHSMLLKINADVIIVEKKQDVIKALNNYGLTAYHINDIDSINAALKSANCVVTATGCKNLISTHFNRKNFPKDCKLVNMSATDEYGEKFTTQDVLYNKLPINFALKVPTLLKFLDPIFYAHNISIDYFLDKTITTGYNSFPSKEATTIIAQWQNYHDLSINELIPPIVGIH
jgi:adenosylhomocysteinase